MKVVGYVHPVFFSLGPRFNFGWIESTTRLLRALRDAGCECVLVTGSRFVRWAHEEDARQLEGLRVAEIDEVSLLRRLAVTGVTPTELTSLVYTQGASRHPALHLLAAEICKCCRGFVPDVVISFGMQTDFLRPLWPHAFRLHCEAGPFARNPYPYSIYLDHLGMYRNSVIGAHAPRLCALEMPRSARGLVDAFRTRAANALQTTNPFDLSPFRARFRHLCLLPLQCSNYFSFDEECAYRTQFEFLVDVVAAARDDVGIIVTEHLPWGSVLKRGSFDDNLDYLCDRFPNLISLDKFGAYYYPSQFLIPQVDGVFSVSSGVALQATLFKRLVGTVASSHLAGILHAAGVREFFARLGEPAASRDDLLAWQLERYWVPEHLFANGPWLADYLSRRREAARMANDPVDAFVPVADTAQLEDAWLRRAPQPCALACPRAIDVVAEMKNSTSWRITAPLRAVGHAVRTTRATLADWGKSAREAHVARAEIGGAASARPRSRGIAWMRGPSPRIGR